MNPNGGTKTRTAVDFDRASDGLDVGPHHVHAHSPARHVRHGLGRGKARLEDELQYPLIGQRCRVGCGDQAPGHGLLANSFDVDPASVVRDFDRHPPALIECSQREPPDARLAGCQPNLRGLDAVVDRVANQMRERITDAFDERAVEFRISPVDRELNLLPTVDCEVTNRPRKSAEDMVHRLHAGLDGRLLKGVRHRVDPLGDGEHGRVVGLDAPELVAGQHEFADEIKDRGQEIDVHPDR